MKIKPNHINMTQIMKKCFNSLFVTLLVLAGLIIGPTTVLAQSNCVCAICGRPCDEISTLGHKPGYSCYVAKKPTPGSTYSGGGQNLQQQMMESILPLLFQGLFAPPPDTSAQDEIARQNAIKRQQEEEQKKRAAIQRWLDIQNEDAMKKQMEDEAKRKQGEKVLSQMQTVGGDKLEPFSFGNPKLDLKPISQNTYPNTRLTTWERLLCSAYFSNLAKHSTKDVDARFYADQAQRVTLGEPTYLECRIPQVSDEKLAKRMEEVKKIYGDMNVKMKDLQDIEGKLTETQEKIKDAEIKKGEATTKLAEIQNRAATAKPEEKAEVDDLTAMAQKQLQDAEQELNQAKESEKDYMAKKEQLENELGNMKSQMQANIQPGDK